MAARKTGETPRGSTTWDYKNGKFSRPAGRASKNGAKPPRWGRLARRNPRDKLTITVTYRGGNQCWYLVEARGSSGVFPGVLALHDVMREIYNDHGQRPQRPASHSDEPGAPASS